MANQGTVNSQRQGGLSTNTPADERLDQSAALVTTDGHARYQEALYTGNVYLAANQALVTVTGLATTVTGWCLTNPVNSGKNLVLMDFCLGVGGAPAGGYELGLAYNASATAVTQTVALVVRNALLPGVNAQTPTTATGQGLVANSATTPTAGVGVRILQAGGTSALTMQTVCDPIDGKLAIGPGSYIHLYFITTSVTTAMCSGCWEEVKI